MWLDYMHENDFTGDSKALRSRTRAQADFARLQQELIRGARKRGDSPEQILALIEETILGILLDEKRQG